MKELINALIAENRDVLLRSIYDGYNHEVTIEQMRLEDREACTAIDQYFTRLRNSLESEVEQRASEDYVRDGQFEVDFEHKDYHVIADGFIRRFQDVHTNDDVKIDSIQVYKWDEEGMEHLIISSVSVFRTLGYLIHETN
jgi:hypothetical protein